MAFSTLSSEFNPEVSQMRVGDKTINFGPGVRVADIIASIEGGYFDAYLNSAFTQSNNGNAKEQLDEFDLIVDLLGISEFDYERRAKIYDLLGLECCHLPDCPQQMAINRLKARQTSPDFITESALRQIIYSVLLETLIQQRLETGTLDKRIREAVRTVLRERDYAGFTPYGEDYPDDAPTLEMQMPLYGEDSLPPLTRRQRLWHWRRNIEVRLFNARTNWYAFLEYLGRIRR